MARIALLLAGASLPVGALALTGQEAQEQNAPSSASRTEASQIAAPADDSGSKAFLGPARRPAPAPTQAQTAGEQITLGISIAPASQISARDQGGSGMAQLSKADLDATLAQLSPAERRVLLQAIDGTDICDNPPAVATIMALCQNRLEARSQEFAAPTELPTSAEEQLLRGDFDGQVLPSVDQVIDRLARASAASDDFSNQAIASIALTAPPAPARPTEDDPVASAGLGEEAQALINALINQLGGRAP